MAQREQNYSWHFTLKSSPEQLWPFVSDTNRFNRDTGVPSVQPAGTTSQRLRNARRRLRLSIYGMAVEWEEQPFEWLRPVRFGIFRSYSKGPMTELRALAELQPRADGGTDLTYKLGIKPRSLFGALMAWLQFNYISNRRFARAFRTYDVLAREGESAAPPSDVNFDESALNRFDLIGSRLIADGCDAGIVRRLIEFIQTADDFALARIRPYELADIWNSSRRVVLETCLKSTRQGLLDLHWEVMCPLCRGTQESNTSLHDITSNVHCETCRIDFNVNFDRFVEVTFKPNALLRPVETQNFCMGSPQWTPHIVAQQLMPAHTQRQLTLPLEPGRYRLRALELDGAQDVIVGDNGKTTARVTISDSDWPNDELTLSTNSAVEFDNATDAEQLVILERVAWSDQSATAAEVTALQVFRDLFSREALRPGEQISVGTLTILFTDLRHSTQLYRQIGDATAFGRVMTHFDVLKQVIAEEGGALVKTIGDAVMAVFSRPASAVRAVLRAQELLASPKGDTEPLVLKAGIHTGPCIAVTLNDRLDYFGTTVNMAARLEGLSTGTDVVISRVLYEDPEVRQLLNSEDLSGAHFEIELKGFENERFELLRVSRVIAGNSATGGH